MALTLDQLELNVGGDPVTHLFALPDGANDVVYNFATSTDVGAPTPYISKCVLSTGVFISGGLLEDAFPISGNDNVYFPNGGGNSKAVLSYDKASIFVISITGADGYSNGASVRLSKISTTTLLETAAVALDAGVPDDGVYIDLVGFRLNSVDYIAVVYNNTTLPDLTPVVDVFNASTLVEISSDAQISITGDTVSNHRTEAVVPGEQPTATTQALYMVANYSVITTLYARAEISRMVFDAVGEATGTRTLVAAYVGTDFDATWDEGSTGYGFQVSGVVFDPSDSSLVFTVSRIGSLTTGESRCYLVKIDTTDGSIVWQVPIGNVTANLLAPNGQLQGTTIHFIPGFTITADWNTPPAWVEDVDTRVLLAIDVATGAVTPTTYDDLLQTVAVTESFTFWDQSTSALLWQSYTIGEESTISPGWASFVDSLVNPEAFDGVGGSGVIMSGDGIIFANRINTIAKCSVAAELEIGPFRFTEQKQADETAMITSLIVGATQAEIGLVTYENWNTIPDDTEDEDYNTEVDVLGNDIYENWGEGSDREDTFTLELMSTDDGISPQMQGIEVLDLVEDHGSTKEYHPQGYSSIFHRFKFKAYDVGDKFSVKFIDMGGTLTGRHI